MPGEDYFGQIYFGQTYGGTLTFDISGAGDIASAEAFGSLSVVPDLSGVGAIASAEAFGTPAIVPELSAIGDIASAEAFGTADFSGDIVVPPVGSYESIFRRQSARVPLDLLRIKREDEEIIIL